MLTEEQYRTKLARLEELCALDPDTTSDAGIELTTIAGECEEYERAHFSIGEIAVIRGWQTKCDFCEEEHPGQTEPEEGNQWACWWCLRRWAIDDDRISEAAFWERCIKENNMMEWTLYTRIGELEARPWDADDALRHGAGTLPKTISVAAADAIRAQSPGGFVARNPANHADQWYVSPEYFAKNYRKK